MALKNVAHMQMVEIQTNKDKFIVINLHLSNDQRSKKSQIEHLKDDLDHLYLNFSKINLIMAGDFNTEIEGQPIISLKRYPLSINT